MEGPGIVERDEAIHRHDTGSSVSVSVAEKRRSGGGAGIKLARPALHPASGTRCSSHGADRGWSLGHVNRDNDSLPTALGFFTLSAPRAFRSGAHNVLS